MGRKSRTKRERREHGSGTVAVAAKGRSLAGLLALVEAAAVSPTANHRVPSRALIFDAALKRVRLVGAHNSVVGADQGLRAPFWDLMCRILCRFRRVAGTAGGA